MSNNCLSTEQEGFKYVAKVNVVLDPPLLYNPCTASRNKTVYCVYLYLRGKRSKEKDFLPRGQWFRAFPRCSLFNVIDKIHPAVGIHSLLPPTENMDIKLEDIREQCMSAFRCYMVLKQL